MAQSTALRSSFGGASPLQGIGDIGRMLSQTQSSPGIRNPSQAISTLARPASPQEMRQKAKQQNGRLAGAQEYNPAAYARQLQNQTSNALNSIANYQSAAGRTPNPQGYAPGSGAELSSASRVAVRMQESSPLVGGVQADLLSKSPAFTQVNGRMAQSSQLNAGTFRDLSGLEDVRNSQQRSMGETMNWAKQQDFNRDKEAFVLQAGTQNWMKDKDADRARIAAMDSRNLAGEGQNFQQAQIDSDANFARQRQLMQDQAQYSFNQTGRPTKTYQVGGGGGYGGGGGSDFPSSSFDPFEMARIQSQYDLGMAQVNASRYAAELQHDASSRASTFQRDASNYGNFMNATISRR